jgi:hypothetical protein
LTPREITELVPEFVAEYERGSTLRGVAAKFGVSYKCVQARLAKAGAKIRSRSDAVRNRFVQVIELANEGKKRCYRCNEIKTFDDFHLSKGRKDGRSTMCKACRFATAKSLSDERRGINSELGKAYYLKHREQVLARTKKYQKDNMQTKLTRDRLRKYGLTATQYTELITLQKGRCAICGTYDSGSKHKSWHVDHDHATGKVRGLLCKFCNSMLGYSKDNPSILLAGVGYLANPPARLILEAFEPNLAVWPSKEGLEMETLQ